MSGDAESRIAVYENTLEAINDKLLEIEIRTDATQSQELREFQKKLFSEWSF